MTSKAGETLEKYEKNYTFLLNITYFSLTKFFFDDKMSPRIRKRAWS